MAAEFELAYGAQGDWARLFAAGEGYRGTQLLRDHADPLRYLTLDFWSSREAHDGSRGQHRSEYELLDARAASNSQPARPGWENSPLRNGSW